MNICPAVISQGLSWRNVRYRLGSCASNVDYSDLKNGGSVGGCNCDHENLLYAASRLYAQKEKNKILIVLCDGQPSGFNGTYGGLLLKELHKAVKKVRSSGIKLFCYGMMAE